MAREIHDTLAQSFTGILAPVIDSVFSWDQVVLAHQRLEQGGTRGKIVLKFTEN